MNKLIGQPVRRKEDRRLLTGKGRYSDDFSLPGQAHAAFVRSPHPHARIVAIDPGSARRLPGVLAVYTGADCAADGLGSIAHDPVPSTRDDLVLTAPGGGPVFIGEHRLLPADKARHVGEAVAMVVAETREQAVDAAEVVTVDYEPLPAVTDVQAATAPRAPSVWEALPGNLCVDTVFGDVAGADAAFARASHVVEMGFHVGRVTGVPLEPRAALATHDAATGRYTLYAGSGGSVRQKREIAAVLGEDAQRLRIICEDVGGNFGTRNRVYVEFALVLWAARKLARPVKYLCTRCEAFVSDYQGRDLHTRIELALAADGRFLALRADNFSNLGARAVSLSPLGKGSGIITGSYDIPVASMRARAAFTNTIPTQAYRSSGRPEVIHALERAIDTAAHEMDIDPVRLRRMNFVRPEAMPYRNAVGMVYDSGEYEQCMDDTLDLADWDGAAARRAAARERGKLLGVGIAHYTESSIGAPREQARLTVRPEGVVDVVIGTQPTGQGHETSFAQVAAELLGLELEQVRIVIGDTDVVRVGGGSHSGRSMRMAGAVISLAAEDLIEQGKQLAEHLLETSRTDIEYRAGRFTVAGTDRAIDLFSLGEAAAREDLPERLRGGLAVVRDNEMHTPVFPNGCAVCEVEIDVETGAIDLTRYAAVEDTGRAVNPMIVHGQTHGSVAQGVGQALLERVVLDDQTGQTLTGSLMDYCMPRADDLPGFATGLHDVPSPTNPLGIKSGGEGATTPALAVVVNAIVDALRNYGVEDIEMPATPFRIWSALRRADRAASPS